MIRYVDILKEVNEAEGAAAEYPAVSLRFLRNYTIEKIEPFLKKNLFEAKLRPEVVFGGYSTAQQEIFQEISLKSKEVVIVTLLLDQLDPDYNQPDWDPAAVKDYLSDLLHSLASALPTLVIVNTFFLPITNEQGIGQESLLAKKIMELNDVLAAFVRERAGAFLLVDWNRLLRQIGEAEAFDKRNWLLFADPFRPAFLAAYSAEICRAIRALQGKAKKCLVLDCDNTLWGGVIGEDGLDGIALDRTQYPGKAYYEFQKTALQLARRGVVLALCSKNNEADVWQVLEQHPYSLIKKEHIVAYKINWNDKATNIKQLAAQLNLGLDSFVFVDDSAQECELIRQLCPEVTVRQVPKKLTEYTDFLLREGLFDTLALSEEDAKRTVLYRQAEERQASRESYKTLEEYLISLQTELTIGPASTAEVARIAQLTQKTNQFNLTTKRYTEQEVLAFAEQPQKYFVAYAKVKDCFGDMGLTGVLIAKKEDDRAIIDTFLLSCRILGRQIEQAFWQECAQKIEQQWQILAWEASYIPTAKNKQVENFWKCAGLTETNQHKYSLLVKDFNDMKLSHIRIVWQEPMVKGDFVKKV